jgi:hypothetical protein
MAAAKPSAAVAEVYVEDNADFERLATRTPVYPDMDCLKHAKSVNASMTLDDGLRRYTKHLRDNVQDYLGYVELGSCVRYEMWSGPKKPHRVFTINLRGETSFLTGDDLDTMSNVVDSFYSRQVQE